jgi:hypothetical protein
MKRLATSPSPSSPGKRSKMDASFADRMAFHAKGRRWKSRLTTFEKDETMETMAVLMSCLECLTSVLSKTDLKDRVIPPLTSTGSWEIVNSFKDEDIKKWKKGIIKGSEDGDWSELIEHRTFCFTSGGRTTFDHCNSDTQEAEQ